MSKNYYDVLGVSKNATTDEIKKQYRKLSKQYHPDMQSGKSDADKKVAEDKFKDISEAYAVLSDNDKRSHYDNFGTADGSFGPGNGQGFDPFEMFRQHFGGRGGFSSFFGGRNPFSNGFDDDYNDRQPDFDSPEHGENIQIKVQIPFADALFGADREIDVNVYEECSECHGKGHDSNTKPTKCARCNGKGQIIHTEQHGMMMSQTITACPSCHGAGWSVVECKKCHGNKRLDCNQKIKVKIPAGISSGQRLRVQGKGQCGIKGGRNGDLYLLISVEESSIYKRDGLDLYSELHLNPITATLGGKTKIMTPYGEKEIDIPIGTSTDKIIKLNGFGIKTPSATGNLNLVVKIEPLANLTNEQKKIIDNIRSSFSDKNVLKLQEYNKQVEKLISK